MNKDAPDFEALRADRNRRALDAIQKIADELGWPVKSFLSHFNPNSCYCSCSSGGSCEHKWDGEDWESEDGLCSSATCSRCGCTAMSHDMRNLP